MYTIDDLAEKLNMTYDEAVELLQNYDWLKNNGEPKIWMVRNGFLTEDGDLTEKGWEEILSDQGVFDDESDNEEEEEEEESDDAYDDEDYEGTLYSIDDLAEKLNMTYDKAVELLQNYDWLKNNGQPKIWMVRNEFLTANGMLTEKGWKTILDDLNVSYENNEEENNIQNDDNEIVHDKDDEVFMKPWVGNKYSTQNNKLLVLGQSLYGGRSSEDRIIHETEWYLDDDNCKRSRFASRVCDLFNFQDLENSAFWNSIAHYEYLLNPKKGPGDKPTKKELEEAKEPFFNVLNTLSPNVVAVLGVSTFDVLGLENYYETVKYGDATMQVYKDNDIYFLRIPHPSGSIGFPKNDYKKLIRNFLESHK